MENGGLVFVLEGVVGLLVILVFYEGAKALLVRRLIGYGCTQFWVAYHPIWRLLVSY
jgi:hypothetical protein